MRSLIIAGISACLLTGCYSSSFQPETSRTFPQTVANAKVIYRGDLDEFRQCEVVNLGTLHIGGNSFISHNDLLVKAQEDAGSRGATHLLVVDNVSTNYITQYHTSCYGGQCNTTPINYPKPVGTFIALHIQCNLSTQSVITHTYASAEPVPSWCAGDSHCHPNAEGGYTNDHTFSFALPIRLPVAHH